MASRVNNQLAHLRKTLEGKTEEEKVNIIKELEMKDQLAYWRAEMLKAYRDKKI